MPMKIEKVNDSQIRCTLTREDLASREIKISELAYGTKKAKNLFKDMMEMASTEYGFEADNIPLMIEAIPVNSECIVLIITKVEDPEELDTRFSKFSPQVNEEDDDDEDYPISSDDDSSILDLFEKFHNAASQSAPKAESNPIADSSTYAFTFASMDELIKVSKKVNKSFDGTASLYKEDENSSYLLVLHKEKMDVADFVKVCNLCSEYSEGKASRRITEAYIKEHFESIIPNDAIQILSEL